jgi:hypothetical protein
MPNFCHFFVGHPFSRGGDDKPQLTIYMKKAVFRIYRTASRMLGFGGWSHWGGEMLQTETPRQNQSVYAEFCGQ